MRVHRIITAATRVSVEDDVVPGWERTQPGRQLRPLSAREGIANEHVQHLADTIENTLRRGGISGGDEVPKGIKVGVYLGAFVEPTSHAGPRRDVAGRAP